MKNKLKFDIRIAAIAFLLCSLVLSAVLERISPKGELPTDDVQVALQNISPCLEPDWKRVERLLEGEPQWICADLKTDRSFIDLGLKVTNKEDGNNVYSYYAPFSSGSIAWIIYPPLPPGKYEARITGFRGPTYANFEFQVAENGHK